MNSVEFSTTPELGSGCVHSKRLVAGSAVTPLHAVALGGPQIVATTGATPVAVAGPCMCAAVTLPLRSRANTEPKRVSKCDEGLPTVPVTLRVPNGFNCAFAAEPVARSRANTCGVSPAAAVKDGGCVLV